MTKAKFLELYMKLGWERVTKDRGRRLRMGDRGLIASGLRNEAEQAWTLDRELFGALSPEEAEAELRIKGGAV